jgi:hypothetical protein
MTNTSHSFLPAGLLRPNISLTIARSTSSWRRRRDGLQYNYLYTEFRLPTSATIFLWCLNLQGRTVSEAWKDDYWAGGNTRALALREPTGITRTAKSNQSIFPYSHNFSMASLLFYLKMEKNRFLRNDGIYLPHYMIRHSNLHSHHLQNLKSHWDSSPRHHPPLLWSQASLLSNENSGLCGS